MARTFRRQNTSDSDLLIPRDSASVRRAIKRGKEKRELLKEISQYVSA